MPNILEKLQNSKYGPVFESIKMIPAQFESTFTEKISIPESYKGIKNIVFCGMGGSALSAHMFWALNACSIPFCFYNGYVPPKCLCEDTLFIASSYSGSTEEVLASLKNAAKEKAKILGLTSGGPLLKYLKSKKYPFIKFDQTYNPSAQPRYGLGYGLGALLNIFIQMKLIDYNNEAVRDIIMSLEQPSIEEATKTVEDIQGFLPIIVASEFLEGNAHTLTNQLNETCKLFSVYYGIPELNHHLMEALKRPAPNGRLLKFVFIESDLYAKEIENRFEVTKRVVKKNKIGYTSYKVRGKTKLEQVMNLLLFGSLVGLVLSVRYKEDPTDIPWVKYFKEELKRMS
ncbi:MAG: SIS domain-containing protein [Patescibacteria group bacterium]